MAGRRRLARDTVTSMGWWGLVLLAIAGSCRCGVWAADSPAMEPSAAPSVVRGEEGGCYRPLSDVIWGFLVTLFAFAVSLWGSVKYRGIDHKISAILVGILAPIVDLQFIVRSSMRCVSILWKCHKMEYPDSRMISPSGLQFLCTSLLPWSKSPVRILASCDIVVYVSKESPLLEKEWLWKQKCDVEDESEAMVVGEDGARRLRDHLYERKQLSEAGLGLLVWKEVFFKAEDSKRLPKYNELKYLRANSGFAIIAIAVQAIGYIYAVVFRMAKDLRISPLEVIGFALNIILLMKVFFYSTCNPCHRPLVIYMDGDWEHETGELNVSDFEKFKLDYSKILLCIYFSACYTVLFTSSLHFIVRLVLSKFVGATPNGMVSILLILFILGYVLMLGPGAINGNIGNGLCILGALLTMMPYIWAIVWTVLHWKTKHFNIRADLINLSQIIPFIG